MVCPASVTATIATPRVVIACPASFSATTATPCVVMASRAPVTATIATPRVVMACLATATATTAITIIIGILTDRKLKLCFQLEIITRSRTSLVLDL
jgi:hypothetical protein